MIRGNALKKGGGKRGYEGGLTFTSAWFRVTEIVLKTKSELVLDSWSIVLAAKKSTMENPRCMSQFQNKFNFTWDEKWGRKCIVNHFIYPLILKFKPCMITWLPRSTENTCCRVLSRAILRGRRPKSALKKPKSNMIRFHGLRMKVTWPCHSFASSKQHVSCTPFHCLVKADSI